MNLKISYMLRIFFVADAQENEAFLLVLISKTHREEYLNVFV